MDSPSSAGERIIGELDTCLCAGRIKTVYFAGHRLAPPPMAFVVRFPRLSLTLSGTDEMEIEHAGSSCTLTTRKAEAVFVPPNCWNRPTWARPVKTLNFLFGEKLIGLSLVEHNGRGIEEARIWKSGLPRSASDATGDILKAMITVSMQVEKMPLDSLLVGALLHAILQSMRHPAIHSGGRGRDRFERICLYVQEHCQQDISRESVAAQFRLNPNHLSRLFQREGLMKFVDYVTRVRIDRAKYLLKNYEVDLEEVAGACGFHDTAYFCRVFKQRTSQTPTGYRLTTWGTERNGRVGLRP